MLGDITNTLGTASGDCSLLCTSSTLGTASGDCSLLCTSNFLFVRGEWADDSWNMFNSFLGDSWDVFLGFDGSRFWLETNEEFVASTLLLRLLRLFFAVLGFELLSLLTFDWVTYLASSFSVSLSIGVSEFTSASGLAHCKSSYAHSPKYPKLSVLTPPQ